MLIYAYIYQVVNIFQYTWISHLILRSILKIASPEKPFNIPVHHRLTAWQWGSEWKTAWAFGLFGVGPGSIWRQLGNFVTNPRLQTPKSQEIPVFRISKSQNVTFRDFKNPTYHRKSKNVTFWDFKKSTSPNPDVPIGHSDNPNRAGMKPQEGSETEQAVP